MPRAWPKAGLEVGAGGGRPIPLWGSRGIIPGKFLKTQMLNPAFWWLVRSLVGVYIRANNKHVSRCLLIVLIFKGIRRLKPIIIQSITN